MTSVRDWSVTASANTGAAVDGFFRENMAYSEVNNAAREFQAILAKDRKDKNGTIAAGGTTNSYVLAISSSINGYQDGDYYRFNANVKNTGATTLQVSSLSARPVVKTDLSALTEGDIVAGGVYEVFYRSASANFQILNATRNYALTATGAVTVSPNAKLRERVSLRDFGVATDLTAGATTAIAANTILIQSAIDWCGANNAALYVNEGQYPHSTVFSIPANLRMYGSGMNFKSLFYPVNCAFAEVSGVHHVVMQDFMVHGTNITAPVDNLLKVNNSYRSEFRNLRFQDVPVHISTSATAGVSGVIRINGTGGENTYHRVCVVGADNTGSGYGFNIDTNEAVVMLSHCDSENLNRGFYCAPNSRADIIAPYTERCGQGIYLDAGSGSAAQTPQINIIGGSFDLPSSTSVGLFLTGTWALNEVVNIVGPHFSSSDHATKTKGIDFSAFTWSNTGRISIHGVDWSWIDQDAQLSECAVITPYDPANIPLMTTPEIRSAVASASGAVSIDLSLATIHRLKMASNVTLTLSNPVAGRTYTIETLQDGTGSRLMTWPAAVLWPSGSAPTLTTTAGRKDVFRLSYNGTNYLARTAGLNYVDTV